MKGILFEGEDMNLKSLAKKVHETAINKGWWDDPIIHPSQCPYIVPRSIGDQFANFHSEISEAWEEYRNGHPMNEVYFNGDKPEGVPVELADCIIRILDTCEKYKIDIQEAIKIKMEYNESRPYKHGGKLS